MDEVLEFMSQRGKRARRSTNAAEIDPRIGIDVEHVATIAVGGDAAVWIDIIRIEETGDIAVCPSETVLYVSNQEMGLSVSFPLLETRIDIRRIPVHLSIDG